MKPARIVYTVPNVTTGEDWAMVQLAPQAMDFGVPATLAPTVVALINDHHRHLMKAIEKLADNDPTWRDHLTRVALPGDEIQRNGRPKVDKAAMVKYRHERGLDAAMKKFNRTARTFDWYEEELKKECGEK